MDTTITEEKIATTTMVGESAIEETGFPKIRPIDDYSHRFATIRDFLARPYELLDDSWSQATLANATLENIDIGYRLRNNSSWMNKIAGYNLVRGTAVLRLQINANPFQQGKLLMHFIPCDTQRSNSSASNQLLLQKTQHPGVEIDCRDTEAVLRIPYITPSHYYDLTSGYYNWGTVFLTVLAPLRMDPSTTSTSVQYSIWLSFEDFEVAAPIPIVPFMDKEAKAAAARPISSALKSAGKVAATLGNIPVLSTYAKPLAWAADIGSKLAYTLGYSKPPLNDSITYISEQGNRYAATATGVDIAYPLSLTCDNTVKPMENMSIRKEDEQSFEFLKKVQCHWMSLAWDVSTPSGELRVIPIAPNLFYQGMDVTASTHVMHAKAFAPFAHITQYFSMWRGGFEMTIKFSKTMYHTGRLEFVWTPSTLSAGSAIQNMGAMRTIVDVRFSDEIILTLPWLMSRSYSSPSEPSGTLTINVLNTLKCPSNVSQTVDMLIYIRAADDYEVAVPLPVTPILPVVIMPYMDVITNDIIGGQNKTALSTRYAEESVGEQFASIRQLLLRYTPMLYNTFQGYNYAINPFFFEGVGMVDTTGALRYPVWGGSLLSQLGSMFAFYRGGMRVAVRLPFEQEVASATGMLIDTWTANLLVGSSLPNQKAVQAAIPVGLTTVAWQNPTSYNNYFSSLGTVKHEGNTIYMKVPYYSDTKCSMMHGTDVDTMPGYPDTPFVWANAYAQVAGAAPGFIWERSIADDFNFSYFVSTPLVMTTYV